MMPSTILSSELSVKPQVPAVFGISAGRRPGTPMRAPATIEVGMPCLLDMYSRDLHLP